MVRFLDVAGAASILSSGGVVVFPTETVYGLGADAYSDGAVSRVFEFKGRSYSNPLSVAYAKFEDSKDDVEITDMAYMVAEAFLPGPVTVVLKRRVSSRVSLLCSAGTGNVGIRVPAHPLALDLLSNLRFPLTASSANKSGRSACSTAEDAAEMLPDIPVLNGGECLYRTESTIVDCSGSIGKNFVVIRRLGMVKSDDISEKCGISKDCIKFTGPST